MAYSASVREAKRAQAVAKIAAQKDTARHAYDALVNVAGVLAGLPSEYAGVFDAQDVEDAAVIADFQATNAQVNSAIPGLQTIGIDALGTDTEV